jgi:hypothetical protein
MAQNPPVSVIIPLYNKAAFIGRALRSVLAQSVQAFEIVVVDDGSTDGGPGILAEVQDPRLRLFRQPNQGVSAARNRGIAQAQANLVAFLDADDEWTATFLETILRLRARFPEAQVFGTSYVYAYEDGHWRLPRLRTPADERWEGILGDYFRVAATSDPPLWSSAVAATKAALQSIQGFPEGVASGEDLLTWAKLAARYPVAYSTQRLSLYHMQEDGIPSMLARRPDPRDVVGAELRKLLAGVGPARRKWLRRYIGLWDKMRASTLLQHGDTRAALRRSAAAMWRRPLDWKLAIYVLLSLLPARLAQPAFVRMLRATEGRRPRSGPVAAEAPGPEGG